uniref:Sulfotransferase n=1 Tax=Neolamprologus brichardi TaxID=32507 RepID=A0A3Q4MJN9_NEOBR
VTEADSTLEELHKLSVRNLCSIPLFCSFILSRVIHWLDIISNTFFLKGTIWAQQIITSIYELDGHVTEYFTNSQKMPWLEWVWGCAGGAYTRRPSPRLFTSHLSQVLMPPGLMDKKGKVRIVYLMRNPKDNMTSYYHFSKTLAGLETPQSFAQFFEWYLTGNGTCLHLHYLAQTNG